MLLIETTRSKSTLQQTLDFALRLKVDHFLKKLFSLPDSDLDSYIEENLVFMDEATRVNLFEELMQMVSDSLNDEDVAERRIAERAEKIAEFINPYDDHQLRGLIRFNTLALDDEREFDFKS